MKDQVKNQKEKKGSNVPVVISKELAQQFTEDARENLKNVNDNFYRVSIRGGRYSVNGDLIGDKGIEFEAIILKEVPVNVYYEQGYSQEETSSPSCWSMGGLKPDELSSQKQSQSCVSCKMNRFGSQIGQKGEKRKGKACHNTRRLVLKVIDVEMPVLMSIPPTSIKSFNHYLRLLTSNSPSLPVSSVKTVFGFDSSVEYPKLNFKQGNILTLQEYSTIKKYKNSDEVISTLNAYASQDDYNKEEENGNKES